MDKTTGSQGHSNQTQAKPATSVARVMTSKIKAIKAGSTLRDARDFLKSVRFRHLPVIEKHKDHDQLVGILSARDLSLPEQFMDLPVETFLVRPVVYINEQESLKSAVFRMLEQKISSLVVVNDQEEMVGIVTTDDLLWQLAERLQTEESKASAILDKFGFRTVGEAAHHLSQWGI